MEKQYVVYFIGEEPFQNRVKIGKSKNVQERIMQLQTGNPNKLYVLKRIILGSSEEMNNLETRLHRELKEKNINGEWFELSLAEIEEVYVRALGLQVVVARNDVHVVVNVNIDVNRTCVDCGKTFRTIQHLNNHKQRKIPCIIRGVAPEQINNPNRCIFCNKIFVQHQHLTRHHKTCKLKNDRTENLINKVKYEQEIRIMKEQREIDKQEQEQKFKEQERKDKEMDETIQKIIERLEKVENNQQNSPSTTYTNCK